jgi:outer membrane protein insertion porin family
MRLSPLLLALAGSAMAVIQSHAAEQAMVEAVEIEGCKAISKERVLFMLTTRVGKPLNFEAVQDDVKAIMRMGPFTNATSELVAKDESGKAVTVVYHVTELPYVGKVHFEGVTYFQKSGLDKIVQTKLGSYLNPQTLSSDTRAIEQHFQDKGYRETKVAVETPIEHGIASVIFTIDLGHEVTIGKVIYKNLPAKILPKLLDQALINMPEKPYQPEFLGHSSNDPSAPGDEGTVARALQDYGYLDAVVKPAVQDWYDYVRPEEPRRRDGPRFVPDGEYYDRIIVTFPIEPGELWYLGSVSFVDNTVASEEELRKAFSLPDGSVYKRVDIEKAVDRSRRLISNQGYARARVDVDRRPDPDKHVMHLTLHVSEGDLYTLERIDVQGNYQTKDPVVRRAVQLRPGDLWNDDKVDESKRQIQRTGLFKNEPGRPMRLSPRFNDDAPGKVDLMVDLDEDSTGALRFQLGYSSAFGAFGEAGYTERNFDMLAALTGQGWRGAGHILDLSAYVSESRTSFGISWTDPHVMDGPYSFTSAFRRTDSSIRSWDEVRLTSSAGVGRSFLNNDLTVNAIYTYADLSVDDVETDAPDDAITGEGDYWLNTIGFNQSYDQLDNPRLPTRGYRITLYEGITGRPMSASTDYMEYSAKADVFFPLHTADAGGVTYVHLSQRWKQLDAIGNTERVPFYERYYGGGAAPHHRGFDQNKLGPREVNSNGVEAYIGGTMDSLATAELSLPLQGTNEGLRLVLFSDYGNVWAENESIDIGDMRTAVGFGIRFPIQLPVSLDFAWLIDSKHDEADSQIHFSLGLFNF